jgi:hypothetical protein
MISILHICSDKSFSGNAFSLFSSATTSNCGRASIGSFKSLLLKLPAVSSHQERPRRQRPRPVPTRACALAPVDGRPEASDFTKKPSRLVGIGLSSRRRRPYPHLPLPLPLDSAWPPAPLPLRAQLARRRRRPVRVPATPPVSASAPSLTQVLFCSTPPAAPHWPSIPHGRRRRCRSTRRSHAGVVFPSAPPPRRRCPPPHPLSRGCFCSTPACGSPSVVSSRSCSRHSGCRRHCTCCSLAAAAVPSARSRPAADAHLRCPSCRCWWPPSRVDLHR